MQVKLGREPGPPPDQWVTGPTPVQYEGFKPWPMGGRFHGRTSLVTCTIWEVRGTTGYVLRHSD
jgi:hypothetical protein